MHPAVGPPEVVAASKGAIDTATIVPRGIRTGKAEATRLTITQNARPANVRGIP